MSMLQWDLAGSVSYWVLQINGRHERCHLWMAIKSGNSNSNSWWTVWRVLSISRRARSLRAKVVPRVKTAPYAFISSCLITTCLQMPTMSVVSDTSSYWPCCHTSESERPFSKLKFDEETTQDFHDPGGFHADVNREKITHGTWHWQGHWQGYVDQ